MYTAPDLIKVKLNVTESFAAYTGCAPDEGGIWNYVTPCADTDDYRWENVTFLSLGWGDGCYHSFNP